MTEVKYAAHQLLCLCQTKRLTHAFSLCFTVSLNNLPTAMQSDRVKIAKIGNKIVSQNTSRQVKVFDDEFFYKNASYHLLIEVDILKVLKGSNVFDVYDVYVV